MNLKRESGLKISPGKVLSDIEAAILVSQRGDLGLSERPTPRDLKIEAEAPAPSAHKHNLHGTVLPQETDLTLEEDAELPGWHRSTPRTSGRVIPDYFYPPPPYEHARTSERVVSDHSYPPYKCISDGEAPPDIWKGFF